MPKGKRTIINADEAHRFHVNDGAIISNLIDLKNIFEAITDEQYHFHVAPGKNDFAAWVKEVLQDEPASKLLFGCLKKKTAIPRIITILRRYNLSSYNVTLPPLVKKEKKLRVVEQQISSPSLIPPTSIPTAEILPPPPKNHNPEEGIM